MLEDVRLSSKGQVVLPKDAREKLGLKKGDKLKLQVDEKTKTIHLQAYVEPPTNVFVRVGTRATSSIIKGSKLRDEAKVNRLLDAIGAR